MANITKKALPRRSILRGIGATLALPLLDAMVPALTATRKTVAVPIPRLGVFYVPNGIMTIIPCSGRQEESFVTDYEPGDVVAFFLKPDTNRSFVTAQDEVRLCKQDMILIRKNGIAITKSD